MRALLFTAALVLTLSATAQVLDKVPNSKPASPGGIWAAAYLGKSVAVDGAYTVAGAPDYSSREAASGVVKIFDSNSGALLFLIHNPSPADNDNFGVSVAISGTRVVVGALRDDEVADDAGSAYVYDLTSKTPTVPVLTLNNPISVAGDNFGCSVAMFGPRVVVGAGGADTGGDDSGSAYVYDLETATPAVPVATLNNPDPALYKSFGASVAISGTRVVVGAYSDYTGANLAGRAYVYDLTSEASAVPVVTLNNPNPQAQGFFGRSVAISGTRVAVGAYQDDTGATEAGCVYVYDVGSATPTKPVTTLNNLNRASRDPFGYSLAMSGTRVVVGVYMDDTGADNAGCAFVYDLVSATPTVPVVTLRKPTPVAMDLLGFSVAISGTRVAVGAPFDDAGAKDAGTVYVYDLTSATPTVPVATSPRWPGLHLMVPARWRFSWGC